MTAPSERSEQLTFQDYTCTCGSGCIRCVVGFDKPHSRVLPDTPQFEAWKNCVCYAGCHNCRALAPLLPTDNIKRWWRQSYADWIAEGRFMTETKFDMDRDTPPTDEDLDDFYTSCAEYELETNCRRNAWRMAGRDRPDDDECDCTSCKALEAYMSRPFEEMDEREQIQYMRSCSAFI